MSCHRMWSRFFVSRHSRVFCVYLAFSTKQAIHHNNDKKIVSAISEQLIIISNDIEAEVEEYEYALEGLKSTINTIKIDDFIYYIVWTIF